MKKKFSYRAYLDGLRGIAVIAVLLFHSNYEEFSEGYLGVDIFFVLSGYLITSIILREFANFGTIDIFRFYARRARRILPGSAVTLLVVSVIFRLLDPISLCDEGRCVFAAASYWANYCFIIEGTDYWREAVAGMENPFKHYWSLSIEEQYYLVYPFVLLVLGWLSNFYRGHKARNGSVVVSRAKYARVLWLIFLIPLMCASMIYKVYLAMNRTPTESHMSSFGRIYQLASGGILGIVLEMMESKRKKKSIKMLRICQFIFFSSIVLLMSYPILMYRSRLISLNSTYSGMINTVLVFVFIFLMEYETQSPNHVLQKPSSGKEIENVSATRRILSFPVFVYFGKWSYSVYLYHFPLYVFSEHYGVLPEGAFRRLFYYFSGSLLLAVISYYLVERTFMRIRIDTTKRKVILASMGLIVPLLLIFLLYIVIVPPRGTFDLAVDDVSMGDGDYSYDHYLWNNTPSGTNVSQGRSTRDDWENFWGTEKPFVGRRVCVYGDSTALRSRKMWGAIAKDLKFRLHLETAKRRPPFISESFKEFVEGVGERVREFEPDLIIMISFVVQLNHYTFDMSDAESREKVDENYDYESWEEILYSRMTHFLDNEIDPSGEIPIVFFLPFLVANDQWTYSRGELDPHRCLRLKKTSDDWKEGDCDFVGTHAIKGSERCYEVVKNVYRRIADKRENTKIVDLDDWQCPGEICEQEYDGVPMYDDFTHFTLAYWIRKRFELLDFLAERSNVFFGVRETEEE